MTGETRRLPVVARTRRARPQTFSVAEFVLNYLLIHFGVAALLISISVVVLRRGSPACLLTF
jgi:hypothetical protein